MDEQVMCEAHYVDFGGDMYCPGFNGRNNYMDRGRRMSFCAFHDWFRIGEARLPGMPGTCRTK